eukprot:MONOS_6672.1-p1 / transcript=MONOS_6672.1 / gene=MONOS_6672 / organism=Monocercomonoides_exilis_PA203 / gene_product=unspecified product / transcript_product=unspecified product / location=Mono_scaffold00214:63831-64997(-) / protein_length=389 / sequence_SO=supercontig / SO=protein_coding / is_pseudo=false
MMKNPLQFSSDISDREIVYPHVKQPEDKNSPKFSEQFIDSHNDYSWECLSSRMLNLDRKLKLIEAHLPCISSRQYLKQFHSSFTTPPFYSSFAGVAPPATDSMDYAGCSEKALTLTLAQLKQRIESIPSSLLNNSRRSSSPISLTATSPQISGSYVQPSFSSSPLTIHRAEQQKMIEKRVNEMDELLKILKWRCTTKSDCLVNEKDNQFKEANEIINDEQEKKTYHEGVSMTNSISSSQSSSSFNASAHQPNLSKEISFRTHISVSGAAQMKRMFDECSSFGESWQVVDERLKEIELLKQSAIFVENSLVSKEILDKLNKKEEGTDLQATKKIKSIFFEKEFKEIEKVEKKANEVKEELIETIQCENGIMTKMNELEKEMELLRQSLK